MESIKNWFQDWSDACEYAKECAPDMSFLTLPEPYSALASIAAVCFAIWWRNESQLRKLRADESPVQAGEALLGLGSSKLHAIFDRAKTALPTPLKKAA
jgi:hypothetical protein